MNPVLLLLALSPIFQEGFDAGLVDWQVVDGNGDTVTWTTGYDMPGGFPVPSGFVAPFAVYDDDAAGSAAPAGVEQLIRTVPLPPFTLNQLELSLDYSFAAYTTAETARVMTRVYAGGAWSSWDTLLTLTTTDTGHAVFPLPAAYLNGDSFSVMLEYADGGSWGWGFAVDNVELRGNWQASSDVGISAILQPVGFIPDSSVAAVPVVLELENHDPSQTLTPSVILSVYDSSGGGPYYSQTLTASLPPSSVQQVSFPSITGLPLDRGYVFHAALFQSGDPYSLNDTLSSGFSLNPPPAGTVLDAFTLTLPAAGEILQGLDVDPVSGMLYVLTYEPGSGVQNTHRLYLVDPSTRAESLLFTVPSLYPSGAASGVYEYMVDVARHPTSGQFWITEYADSAGHLAGAWVLVVDTTGALLDTFNYAVRVDPFAAPHGVDADPVAQRMYLMSLPSPGYGAPLILRVDDTLGLERGYPVYNDLTYSALAVIPVSRRFVLGNDLEVLLQDVVFDSVSWGDSVFHAYPLSKIKESGIRGIDFLNETSPTATAKIWAVYGDTLHTVKLLSLGRRYQQVPVEEQPVHRQNPGHLFQVQAFRHRILRLRFNLPTGTPYRMEMLDALGRVRWARKGKVHGDLLQLNLPAMHGGVYFLRLNSPRGSATRRVIYAP